MAKYFSIFIFIFFVSIVHSQTKESLRDTSCCETSRDFIFIINPEDCVSCLLNTYNLVNYVSQNNIDRRNLILVLKDKREIIRKNYIANFSQVMPLNALTVIWNTELYEKFRKSAERVDDTSIILIFDKKANKYSFNKITKNTTPADLNNFFESN